MPYELDTVAAFDFVSLNGRALTDDVMDLILTLATNTALGDGVTPDRTRTRSIFPYFGAPYTSTSRRLSSPTECGRRSERIGTTDGGLRAFTAVEDACGRLVRADVRARGGV